MRAIARERRGEQPRRRTQATITRTPRERIHGFHQEQQRSHRAGDVKRAGFRLSVLTQVVPPEHLEVMGSAVHGRPTLIALRSSTLGGSNWWDRGEVESF